MINRPSFITPKDFELLQQKYKTDKKLNNVLEKIKNDYPVQYAIGNVEFLNLQINVNKNVLIPRFETELLVDKLIKYIEINNLELSNTLDLCTGSGCIALALKSHFSRLNITAVDKSIKALLKAYENSKINNLKVNFIKKDILKKGDFKQKFSILVSNPPYVKLDEYVTPNTAFEPKMALYPGDDDIIFYKKILDLSSHLLYPKNIIAFEIGSTQSQRICSYAKKIYPDAKIIVERDYNNLERFIFIFNNCE